MQFPTLEQMVFVERVAAPAIAAPVDRRRSTSPAIDVAAVDAAAASTVESAAAATRRSPGPSSDDEVAHRPLHGAGGGWSGGVGARLYDLQVRRHPEFARKATSQQQRVVEIAAPRGAIYDARGRELAVSVEVESLYASPGAVPIDRERTAAALAPILNQNAARARASGSTPIASSSGWRASSTPRCRAACASSRCRASSSSPRAGATTRCASSPRTRSATSAWTGEGLGGLEARYESVVRGQSAQRVLLRDALRESVALPEHPFDEPVPGQDLHLTLDASLQYMAEKELRRAVETSRARSGVVIILDPRDSAVLTLASYPTFDPNAFSRYPPDAWKNHAIADVFEPGLDLQDGDRGRRVREPQGLARRSLLLRERPHRRSARPGSTTTSRSAC